jgi:hypothetical protein
MTTQARCACSRCTIRGLMGPAVITTLGILFLLSELGHGMFSFGRTFPVLFIIIGAILLASAVAPMDGHIGPWVTPVPPLVPQAPPTNPPSSSSSTYNPPYSGQGQ